jgi:predicted acyl esterase
VLPELPWHRYHEEDYDERPFADGRVVELVIDLLPTSWVFEQGHRIRLSITGADQPSFALHPAYEGAVSPTYYIHTGDASYLDLPVIPD